VTPAVGELAVDRLGVAYGGVTAVDALSFVVNPGEVTTLLGANGAGKTSALRGIGGLVRTARGTSITLGGRELVRMDPAARARAGLGHCLEDRHVFPGLSVEDNLRLGAIAAHRRPAMPLAAVYELFPELAERPAMAAGRLSGGQQQFLAIGRALVGAPAALMLDEPTNGLAPMLVERVCEILRDLKARGLAILLVEQRLEVAQAVGDTVLLMSHGQIVRTLRANDPDLPALAHDVYMGGEAAERHRVPG
jgi:ABC-type branched-subunit amino acid transport system ATPase component